MKRFLEVCHDLRLDQVSLNGQRIRASIPALQSDMVLFLVCGYDFIHHPNDLKFRGIEQLFVRKGSPFQLNLGTSCIDKFSSMVSNPTINASVEGTSVKAQPGMRVDFNPATMVKSAGARAGGAGNYNLQTKALDMLLTDPDGVDRQQMLTMDLWPRLVAVCSGPPTTLNAIGAGALDDMRDTVRTYWGGDTARLGL